MNIASDFFMVNQENPEKEEEDLRILNDINHRKKPNPKFHIEKYEKFKPKPKKEIGKIDSTIIKANSKVKLLLSSFLHDLKTEQKNEEYNNSNIITQIKRKRTKILKKKATIRNKKNSSSIINIDIPSPKLKKINTISGNKYYKNENKNSYIRSSSPFNKKRNNPNSKSSLFNSCRTLKDNLQYLQKKCPKNFDSGINNTLMSNNVEKSKKRNSIDIQSHHNEVTWMSDIEKDNNNYRNNSSKKFKKYKRAKTKFRNSIKNSTKPEIKSSLYTKFDLNDIINEKLLKLTGDIQEGNEVDKMLKESKNKHSVIQNNFNLEYYFNYFNNNLKNSNINNCSNISDKEKSEVISHKKDFNINDFNKIEKTENINDFKKSIISNGKVKFNVPIRRTGSSISPRKYPLNYISKKKYEKKNTLKDLKETIKNSIILRPEELNLTNVSDINNSQKKIVPLDKEKLTNIKINNSIDNKNIESNLSYRNQNADRKGNKSKFDKENEVINSKINDNSNNENESQIQEKKSFCSLGGLKTKTEMMKENFRVLICKKLVYDSMDDEEVEEEYNNKYIHPDSLFIRIFDDLVSILAFFTFIYAPYYLASKKSFCKNFGSYDSIIGIFVEIIYLLDFIFGFFKGYYNFEEQLIINNITIIKQYLLSWFLLDLISAFPLYSYIKIKEPLCSNTNVQSYGEVLHNLHYLIILNKLLKTLKINFINHNFISFLNKLGINSTVLIQLLIFLSGLHLSSCLHIFIGRNSYPNWIIEMKLENAKFIDLYISSIYSILTSITTVGYGDIVCHSFNERIFQIFLLIVGSLAYSWLVSSFSNYIQKCNEKSVGFENRKLILDEIRYNYPKMSNYLYERVLQYIKYKNCNEKRDKNMIFDCLPIGLKNNLVYEMYKPIVKNFIFFKNFGNTDFIVRVILAFRPIIAFKNDVLLNEGDMVDDILFVKKGVLSVQVPINIKNPEEYINKYSYGDILEQKDHQNDFLNLNQTFLEKKNNDFLNSVILQQGQLNFLNLSEKEDLFNRQKKKEEEIERKKNTRYIKIVSIRENEHFGDVLMFLDQRSPLRVKVTSKKAELFFLKKMDVVKISSNYQNIWRRINKRSVFNFEQIKKSIPKMVELYCKFKGFMVNKIDEKMTRTTSKRVINKRTMLPTTKLKMRALTVKNPKRTLTQQYKKRKIFTNKYFPKDDFSYEYKRIKTHVAMNLHKNILNNSGTSNDDDSNESSESSESSDDDANNSRTLLNKKLMNTYNRQYKYYVGSKGCECDYKREASIIKEESETESSITPLKTTNVIKNKLLDVLKNTNISNNNNFRSSLIKNNYTKNRTLSKDMFDDLSQDQNETNSIRKRTNMEIINEKDETFRNKRKEISSDNESNKKRKSNVDGESLVNGKVNSLIINTINDEFNISEEIKIPMNESLLNRHISSSKLLSQNNIISMQKINETNKLNLEKILCSNKTLNQNSNSIDSIINKNNNQVLNININNYKKIFANENLIPDNIITDIQISSIYNNLHSINNKYYLNKNLQETVKQLLLEEDTEINSGGDSTVKKLISIGRNKSINKSLNKSLNNTLNNTLNNNNIDTNSSQKNNLLPLSILPSATINKSRFKKRVRSYYGKRSSTFSKLGDKNENFNSPEILKKEQKLYETNIGLSLTGKTIFKKQNFNKIASPKKQSYNVPRKSITKNGYVAKENNLIPLNNYKNTTVLSPDFFNKKRKTNLLSTINFNIEKNSQNINNPNEFYSSYFQSLLENEKKNASKFRTKSIDFRSQFKKNKK